MWSTLGAVLFLLYVNNTHQASNIVETMMFADHFFLKIFFFSNTKI